MQKAVELGVTAIVPLLTQRCGVKVLPLASRRRSRFVRSPETRKLRRASFTGNQYIESDLLLELILFFEVAESAAEQCGRSVVPLIARPTELSAWLANLGPLRERGMTK